MRTLSTCVKAPWQVQLRPINLPDDPPGREADLINGLD